MKKVIHIFKINEVRDYHIYCVFSNGEYRYVDLKLLLEKWKVKEDNILYSLHDLQQLKGVMLKNDTLTWSNITKEKTFSNGQTFKMELDLDPIVLYENSKIDEERDSAFQLERA